MSFIAGIVSLSDDALDPKHLNDTLRLLPPDAGRISTYRDDFAAISQIDFGGFGEPGFCMDETGVTATAGHPLLPGDRMEGSADGARGVRTLHRTPADAVATLAATATGTWAAARYLARDRVLLLCSDRMGGRPLYWWTDGRIVVFASSLWFMEQHPLVPLTLDLQGVLEGATLTYILADRTPYIGVHRMLESELVRFTGQRVERSHYYSWSDLQERPAHESLEVDVLNALASAVERRNGNRREAVTLLSGGLDSRVVNALLHDLGVRINSFNFSMPNTQDAVFGQQFADAIGANHFESMPVPGIGPGWAHKSGRVWDTAVSRSGTPLRQLFPVWSGDFGSAFASWGGVTPSIASAMREGKIDKAVAAYLRTRVRVAPGDVVPEARSWFATAVPHAVAEEIARQPSTDPARQFMLFYLANSRRRNMDRFYEEILDHRTEFWTPFSDSLFMEAALAVPVEEGMGHHFYMRWFNRLPEYVRQVPWQSYRGSVPCPLPIPDHVKSQWDRETKSLRAAWRREARPFHWQTLVGRFPGALFKRHRFIARAGMHQVRWKNGRRPLEQLEYIARYWNSAEHRPRPWSRDGQTEGAGRLG